MAAKNTLQFFLGPLLKKFFQDMGRDPNNLEMILIKQKAGQLLKDSNKVINFPQKKSFMEQVEAMKKSGDLVDKDNIIISDKITNREMFKNSNLNKPTIEGQMEKITGASNRIKEIQKEIDEMYRPKTDAEIKAKYDKQNKESIQKFKDKMKKDEPEDKADGGRIGFRVGKFVLDKVVAKLLGNPKKVKQAVDDIFPTGDYKYDAQMAADALVENNPKIFKNRLYEDLDLDTQMEIYGAVLGPIQKNMSMAIKMKKASRPEKTLAAMKEGKGIDMSDPNIADEFTRFMKETDPQGSKTIEQTVELANFDPKKVKGNAEGGRIGYYTGGITDVEPRLDDIGHGADSLMSRTRLMSPGSQATTSTGLNYLLAEDNDNLRVPFKVGGDAGRRAFLKLLATLTGGAAAFKTGILGLGEGTAKKAVTETVKQSAGNYPPPYFFKLVEKIKFMGDDITEKAATKDREIVKRYKDFEMTEDVATGDIVIKKRNEGSFYDQDGIVSDEYIVYKPGQADEATKMRTVDEYDEYTVRPDAEGKLRDSEDGLDSIDEILEEVGDVDSMTLKKADGGRIGYNIGGLSKLGITGSSRRFLEKVFGKEKFKNMIENDPELHRGMLEVVEMFRAKDKTGLVEYMQNFLPQMSKKEIEDFIVGSGDISGIEGQLIRLGSGRDYQGKIQMMKEADNVRKLENFDIDGVSKNAEGGRIELKGGGDALKAIIKYFAKDKGIMGSQILKDINLKSLPSSIKNLMSKSEISELQNNRTEYVKHLLNIMKSDKKFLDNVKANTDEAIATAPIGMEDIAKEMAESIKRNAMKENRLERLKIYDKVNPDDAIMDVEVMIKNMTTGKDKRKLQAQGGLTTMLGE